MCEGSVHTKMCLRVCVRSYLESVHVRVCVYGVCLRVCVRRYVESVHVRECECYVRANVFKGVCEKLYWDCAYEGVYGVRVRMCVYIKCL